MEDGASVEAMSGFCPLYHRAIEIIGRRWTGAIIRALPLSARNLARALTDARGTL